MFSFLLIDIIQLIQFKLIQKKYIFKWTMGELYQLKRLHEDQIEDASRVLGRAFQDDPLFVYCIPDPIEREIKTANHCEWLILLGIINGEVYTSSSNIEGVAIWHPYNIKDQKSQGKRRCLNIVSLNVLNRIGRIRLENA